MKTYGLISENDDFTNNWMFIFEFNIRSNQVTFDCKIGQGEQEKREILYELYRKHNNFFTKVVKANGLLKPKWHQAYQKTILSKSEVEKYLENDSNDIESIIEKRFRELIDKDLPKLIDKINEEIKDGSS